MREITRSTLRLLCILAHPDDESLGTGGILARYAAEGVATYLITATLGERGWLADPAGYPGPAALGEMRQSELEAAAATLGLREVTYLPYLDGELDQADAAMGIRRLVGHIRRIRPDVVVTFDPNGYYGHPDHVAISQWTTAAVMTAADPTFHTVGTWLPHRTGKLYYLPPTSHQALWGEQTFYRAFSLVNGGRAVETDLFAGFRPYS